MIHETSSKQLTLSEFDWPFQVALDEDNRWVKLSQLIPWDEFAPGYHQQMSQTRGRTAKPARLVIGAVIIKHRLCLSDREINTSDSGESLPTIFRRVAGLSDEGSFCPFVVGGHSQADR